MLCASPAEIRFMGACWIFGCAYATAAGARTIANATSIRLTMRASCLFHDPKAHGAPAVESAAATSRHHVPS
jgi:hypothetical protein